RPSELSMSELRVNAPGKHVRRSAVYVVAGIADELIIHRNPRRSGQCIAVISLDDSFNAGIPQLPVSDQNAGPAGIEIGLVYARNCIDDGAIADRVVRPTPIFAVDRHAA